MRPNTYAKNRALLSKLLIGACSALIATNAIHAQPTAPAADAPPQEEAVKMMEYFVAEKGVSRATNSITAAEATIAIPGTSVDKLIDLVPGVNVTTRDPFGFYEFGNDIRVRSFSINAVGVTMDDVPMGNNSPRFGLPAGRVTDQENIATINVSQGTGDLSTPAYEALGGSIKYYTSDPSVEPGIRAKYSLGDFDLNRVYFRADTGELLPGLTAWVSGSRLAFKTAGIPDDSTGEKFEAKVKYSRPNFTGSFIYTYNNRDDYDTVTVRIDRLRALETGRAFAVYPESFYDAQSLGAQKTVLNAYAANGFIDYTPASISTVLADDAYGNLTDGGRVLSFPTFLDTTRNLGDGINSRNYFWQRNGRTDNFMRAKAETSIGDVKLLGVGYYQDRKYYGTAAVSRADIRTQIRSAYTVSGQFRPDIWARWAYRDPSTNLLVPFGTAGAVPVGYNDTNGNGFFDKGETLSSTVAAPTAFSNGHALIGADSGTSLSSATSGLPGHSARFENFGGDRYGAQLKGTWEKGINTLSAGVWIEKDNYFAVRPQYNLQGGNIRGPMLFDQVLFLNYDQNYVTDVINAFVEDRVKLLDDRLGISFGAKFLQLDRVAEGILYTTAWHRASTLRRETRDVTYKDSFLPQAGITFKVSNSIEAFANYAENLAAPQNNVIANADFDAGLSPERSENYDLGIRYTGRTTGATFAVFLNKYEDRIGSIPLTIEEQQARGLAGVPGATVFQNLGSIESKGFEASGEWRTPVKGLKMTGSLAYIESVFEDPLRVGASTWMVDTAAPASMRSFYSVFTTTGTPVTTSAQYTTATATGGPGVFALANIVGKTQVNTPEWTANLDASYVVKAWTFTLGGEFRDSVYLNVLNTETLDSYVTTNATVTWSGPKGTRFEPFKVSLAITNLLDKDIYYATSGTATQFFGTAIADYGRNIILSVEAKF